MGRGKALFCCPRLAFARGKQRLMSTRRLISISHGQPLLGPCSVAEIQALSVKARHCQGSTRVMCGRKLGFSSGITVNLGNYHHSTKNGRTFQNGMAIVNTAGFCFYRQMEKGTQWSPVSIFPAGRGWHPHQGVSWAVYGIRSCGSGRCLLQLQPGCYQSIQLPDVGFGGRGFCEGETHSSMPSKPDYVASCLTFFSDHLRPLTIQEMDVKST